MTIASKITSMQSTIGVSYKRPDPEKLEKMQVALSEDTKALDYLFIERGLSTDTMENFKLGYDKERHAIAIPVFKRGELVNIKYRFIEPDKIKYSQERGAEIWIYNEEGIEVGLKKGAVLIVEGEFDAMSAWQAGIKNVVSPASGKDSYGMWLELLDNIPEIYIAYDNDKPGKEAGKIMAERLLVEKCKEVTYPEGTKDANEYFKKYTYDDFKELLKDSQPFYRYTFKNLPDIIDEMRAFKDDITTNKFMPFLEMEEDWLIVLSGSSNVGKTSVVMNIANDFVSRGIPCLVMPFERGIKSVAKRFIQVKYDLSRLNDLPDEEWDEVASQCAELPLYFALPKKNELLELLSKSKRIFNTKVVIIDHLDYIVRNSQNKEAEIGNTLQELKRTAEENKMIMIIVTHIRKISSGGFSVKRKPHMEDLKGSSSLYQDPECVLMLDGTGKETIEIRVVKNKGRMGEVMYSFNQMSGRLTPLEDENEEGF